MIKRTFTIEIEFSDDAHACAVDCAERFGPHAFRNCLEKQVSKAIENGGGDDVAELKITMVEN